MHSGINNYAARHLAIRLVAVVPSTKHWFPEFTSKLDHINGFSNSPRQMPLVEQFGLSKVDKINHIPGIRIREFLPSSRSNNAIEFLQNVYRKWNGIRGFKYILL